VAKLLLVEDDNNLREIYEARLSAEGYDITTAQNGEEALSVAKSVHPDLIISDVMMPRISGFEMLDILRNTDELKNTKIIMLTALGQAEDRGRADNLGADRYLVKSQVTLEDIVKAAEELLSDTPAGAAPAETTPAPEVAAAPAAVTEPAPVAATPVAPEMPAPSMNDAPVAAPAVPVEPAVSPVVPAPEPVAAPMPTEPVTPDPTPMVTTVPQDGFAAAPTTVTVPDPDPIAVEPAAPEVPAVEVPAAPAAEATIPSASQSLAAEEEAIQQQIASFAGATEPVSTPVAAPDAVPTPVSTANDAVLAQAMSDLTSATNSTAEAAVDNGITEPVPAPSPMPDPTPVPVPAPQPDTSVPVPDSQQVTGRKVIQPLDEAANVGTAPDLQALLAAEDAKEAASTTLPVAPQPAAAPVVEQPKPAIDPNTIAL